MSRLLPRTWSPEPAPAALPCPRCGQPLHAWTRMPFPVNPTDADLYQVHLGNLLIAHGWITDDGLSWRHPQEPGDTFDDKQAISRELGKLRARLRAEPRPRARLRDVREEYFT